MEIKAMAMVVPMAMGKECLPVAMEVGPYAMHIMPCTGMEMATQQLSAQQVYSREVGDRSFQRSSAHLRCLDHLRLQA